MATDARTFELRTYLAAPGKLDALLARFRDHTTALFEKTELSERHAMLSRQETLEIFGAHAQAELFGDVDATMR